MVSDRRTEVHPTVLRDLTTAASDSEAHAVEHDEVGERSGANGYTSSTGINTEFKNTSSVIKTMNNFIHCNKVYKTRITYHRNSN